MVKFLKRLIIVAVFIILAFFSFQLQNAFAEDPTAQCQAEGGFCTALGICRGNPPPGNGEIQDTSGNRLCSGVGIVCCMAAGTNNEPGCNSHTIYPCTNAWAQDQWNNSGSNVACFENGPYQYNTGTLYGCSQQPPVDANGDACERCGGYCNGGVCPVPGGYENSADYFCGGSAGMFCDMPIPNCWTNNVFLSQGACGGAAYNTCNANNGHATQTWQHQGAQICYYNNYNVSVACTQNACDGGNGYTCQSSLCAKTMGGRVTNANTGAGIDGVVIAGGGTTAGGGYWTNTDMPYNHGFTFTAPSAASSFPCNNGYECGSASPNPGSYTGTVGGAGDCGMNCNFTYTPGSISGYVFIDTDHDGNFQAGDTFIQGVLVQDTAGAYTYTDANGYYKFDNLSTTTYTVYVHDFQGYKVITSPYTLAVPPNRTGIDFAITPAYSVSGYVFTDWNYNNNFDAEDNSYIPPPAVNVVNTAATVPVLSDAPLALNNPSFETGGNPPSGWNFWVTAPAAGTVNQDCSTAPAGGGNCSAHVNVSTPSDNFWWVTLAQQNVSLNQGEAYEVSFYAKAGTNNVSHPMWVFLQMAPAPWVGYGIYNPTIPNDNTWRQYSFVFTSDYTDAATNFEFEFAKTVGDVWIDNVVIRPMSYTVPKLYNGSYSQTLSPLPANTAQSPCVPNQVTVNGADVLYQNLGISPLYSVDGNVYINASKDGCFEPAYDPLYTNPGTLVTFQDQLAGCGNIGTKTFAVTNGLYSTGITLHAGTYSVTYAAPSPYTNVYPPVGFSIVVGNPAKSLHCDVTLAQNVVCW